IGQLQIVDLVRKLAEDFAKSFPRSTMDHTQPQSQVQPQTQRDQQRRLVIAQMEETCAHSLPASLASLLPKLRLFPTCTIDSYAEIIQDVQKVFTQRGGWSLSKEMGDGHKSIRQEWRKAKVGLTNMVTKLEDLLANTAVSSDVAANIKPALEAFEKKKAILAWVPGVKYVKDAEELEPTEEDHESARLMIELLRLILDKGMSADDKAYAAKRASNASTSKAQQSPLPRPQPQTPEPSPTPAPQADQSLKTPKSILKRKSSISPLSSLSPKRICITEVVTVSPSHILPADHDPMTAEKSSTVTSRSNNKHTFAEASWATGRFWRPSPRYLPGSWASEGFLEKVNTRMLKKADEETARTLKKQEQKDKKATEGLTLAKVVWVAVCWVAMVSPHVETFKRNMEPSEKIREKMRERIREISKDGKKK
ncbi:hypothetical protein CC86DRAFT_304380, partial [Ophiobolus disseminans]